MLEFLFGGILTLANILPGCLIYSRWLGRFHEGKTSKREDVLILPIVFSVYLLGLVLSVFVILIVLGT